jgi:hypothetical protein
VLETLSESEDFGDPDFKVKYYHHGSIFCKSSRALSLLKGALRDEGCPWLIKTPGHMSLGDGGYFNTPPHVWQLLAKHVFNIGRERPIIV